MKKSYLFMLSLAVSSLMASAQNPTLMWANNFNYLNDGGAMLANIGYNITMASDGNLLVFNDCGTTADSQEITFGDQVVGVGTNHGSTSYNHSMVLVKTDAQTGAALWSVYSTSGDGASNNGMVAATNDGGAYMVAKLRHTAGQENNKINFVDATGANTTLDWQLANSNRYYQVAILKVNAQGAIEWYRMIDVDSAPVPGATSAVTSDAITIGAVTVDGDNNLYVGGRFVTSITFNNGITLTSQSSEGWDGSSQNTRGDLFIAKFDANGNYVKSMVQQGVTTSANIASMTMNAGKIYFAGYIESNNDIMLGGIALAKGQGENYRDLLVGCMDTELNVEWAKTLIDSYKGAIYNKLSVNVIGDNMWVSGKVRTNLTDAEGNNYNWSGKTRDGMLLRLNKEDGSWLGATAFGTNQAGFNGVFESKDDANHVYVLGHVLMGNLYVQQYNIEDMTAGSQWALVDNSMDIQNCTAICDSHNLYVMGRAGKGNTNVFYGADACVLTNTIGQNAYVAAFTLPVGINNGANDGQGQGLLLGDVNNDGELNISDVSAIIDYLLGNPSQNFNIEAADVNGNEEVNIGDVSALIDLLLKQ